jgi:hypothetical protein
MFVPVRQLEQQVKSILDSIAVSEERKKDLIRGDAVDKAEQLSELSFYLHTHKQEVIPLRKCTLSHTTGLWSHSCKVNKMLKYHHYRKIPSFISTVCRDIQWVCSKISLRSERL